MHSKGFTHLHVPWSHRRKEHVISLLHWGKIKIERKTEYLRAGQEFDEKLLDSKHVLKVIFNPSRKNKDFLFSPYPILVGWLKILHLKDR